MDGVLEGDVVGLDDGVGDGADDVDGDDDGVDEGKYGHPMPKIMDFSLNDVPPPPSSITSLL